jgi:hypothetical protein
LGVSSEIVPTSVLRPLDLRRAAAKGIRVLEGRYLTLLTDLPAAPEIDELPAVFDAAVPQWCDYYGINPRAVAHWKPRGFLMTDRKLFEAAELVPKSLVEFPYGYTFEGEIYLLNPKSDYYRRHLLLHEGTHVFQFEVAKIRSEQWYAEGIAEHFATHSWKAGRLRTRFIPSSDAEVSKWGRIEMVQQALENGQALTLAEVARLNGKSFAVNSSYGWTWHLAVLLDLHPRYQRRFRELQRAHRGRDLSAALQTEFFLPDQILADDFASFTRDAVYGYDWQRTAIDYRPGKPFPPGVSHAQALVAADRGWQASGVQLQAGKAYRITARGTYLLRKEPTPWQTEPNGITLRYHHGQPLGILLAAIRGDSDENTANTAPTRADSVADPAAKHAPAAASTSASFRQPFVVGHAGELIAPRGGTLYFKLNDSAAELSDNQGSVEVAIELMADTQP